MILEKVVKMLCDDCWAHNKNRRCNKTDAPLCYGYLAESILSIPEIKDALKTQENLENQLKAADKNYLELKNEFDNRIEQAREEGYKEGYQHGRNGGDFVD